MHPVWFHMGSRPIHWYGVMMALAFLMAMGHWAWLARRTGRPAAFGADLMFWIMVASLLGSRAVYLAANLGYYLEHPAKIWRLDEGGLVFYGGLLGGVAAVWLFARSRRERVWDVGDFAVTPLPLGHALGRLGCFLNGCCFGRPTGRVWGVRFPAGSPAAEAWPGRAVHPVQLYEALAGVAIYLFLLAFFFRRRREGSVVAAYFLSYAGARFFIEFFRGDERLGWGALNSAQWFSLFLFAAGLLLWFVLPSRQPSAADGE